VLAIGIFSVAVWVYLLLARGGFWRIPKPSRVREAAVPAHANVVIVIPARDEAASIGQALDSLVDQASIIVVDDHSSDATADVASRHGATVLSSRPLPPGWTGKMWAAAQGVDAALATRPDYVLLTDADIVHAPGNVAGLVARAEAHGFDLVSLMVRLRTESFAERALIPAFVFFFLKLYPPAWIASPRHRTAGAAGGCMLIRRETIERIGGIERIRGELIDDCALARAVKRTGGKVWLGLTRESRSIRAYGGFGEIWRMISRTAFTQLNYSPLLLCGTLAGLALTYLAPPVLALTFSRVAAPLGAAAWLMMSISYAPMLRIYGRSILWAPALPLVALFYAGATIDSAVRYWTGRGGAWKGRTQALKTTPNSASRTP
jgi:hopene-associated glycosyltransferase HpnB